MHLREATAADWPAIWPFLRTIMAAGDTYTWPVDVSAQQARAMWMQERPGHTAVAVGDDGTVLGSAKVRENQLGPGAHVANGSFLVDPAAARRGVGRALAEYALDWARGEGFRAMQFNAVVETNTGAVALWKSLGFEIVGTVPEGFRHPVYGYVGLYVMYRRL